MSAIVLVGKMVVGLLMILIELTLPAMSEDFRRAAELILRGALSPRFWIGTVLFGTLVPVALLVAAMRSVGGGSAAAGARRAWNVRGHLHQGGTGGAAQLIG